MAEHTRKNQDKDVDAFQMGAILDDLYNSPNDRPAKQKRSSLRRAIEQNTEKIDRLLEIGWTGKEICEYLREKTWHPIFGCVFLQLL